jgi:thiamine-phosphate pyrophosphorylase
MPKAIDYSLYLISDKRLSKEKTILEVVKKAVPGGVTIVQLREKSVSTKEFILQALCVKDFLNAHKIPLIINDRVDVAMAVHANGVHLGQNDMPLKMARDILKNSMIIGASAHSVREAIEAEASGADYLGVGPVFPTTTKKDTNPVCGPEEVCLIKKSVKIPVVGIGGISKKNAHTVIKHGADGIAVVSAIVTANDPEKEADMLRKIIDQEKTELKQKYLTR